jgi:hypothetical protein
MRSIITSVFLCGILSACTQPTGTSGQDVTFTKESGKNFIAGYMPVDVQIVNETDANNHPADDVETSVTDEKFTGVCKIREARYTATVKVPGKVSLPAYSQGALPIDVSCTFNGKTKQVRLQPENLSRLQRQSSNVGVAILCPVCGLGAALGTSARGANREGDVYGFRKIAISPE